MFNICILARFTHISGMPHNIQLYLAIRKTEAPNSYVSK